MNYGPRFLRANPGSRAATEDTLELILHAKQCRVEDFDSTEECPEQRCGNMRAILHHSRLCERGELCDVEGCFDVGKLKRHFKKCRAEDCEPCVAVRNRQERGARKTPPPTKVDVRAEKRGLQIQLLEFVTHIHKCQTESRNGRMGDCGLANCQNLEDALLHRSICLEDLDCAYPGCVTTGYVMEHWSMCDDENCLVCAPIKISIEHCVSYRTLMLAKPRKRFFISQHIEQVLHTLLCLQRDQDPTREINDCPRSNCERMKDVLLHIKKCKADKCPKPQCRSSKQILKHWRACYAPYCLSCVCESKFKSTSKKRAPLPDCKSSSAPSLPVMYPPGVAPHPRAAISDRDAQQITFALLHAQRCSARSKRGAPGLEIPPCGLPDCQHFLEIYHHVMDCGNYVVCEENTSCVLARELLHHWQTCEDVCCQRCIPVSINAEEGNSEPVKYTTSEKIQENTLGLSHLQDNEPMKEKQANSVVERQSEKRL